MHFWLMDAQRCSKLSVLCYVIRHKLLSIVPCRIGTQELYNPVVETLQAPLPPPWPGSSLKPGTCPSLWRFSLTCLSFSKLCSWRAVPHQEGIRIYSQPLDAQKRLPRQSDTCNLWMKGDNSGLPSHSSWSCFYRVFLGC